MSLQEIPLEQGVKAHAAGDNRLQLEQDFEAHALILSRQSTVCLALRVRVWDACFSFRGVRVTVLVLLAILFAATFFVIENNHHHDLARNSTNFTCIAESNSSVCVGPSDFEETRLTFSDALFLSVSVISATGLQTVDFSQWSVASQIIASE